ncbi:sugar phosphate isomerase/epimerase family protein [Taklimakanibacter deserti]|uniref:sugar phosphate isomerase/epimerase family protein n=1 Tax=Taklimakanibacter deserti TaxID=2267839 RepID=UPI000E659470
MRDLAGHPELCAINTATLGFTAPIGEVIEAVARHGFGGIALWRREVEGQDVKRIALLIRDAKLKVTGYCRSTFIPAATVKEFRASIEDNKRAIADASVLGAENFVMVVGGLAPGSKDLAAARRQVAEATAELVVHGREHGVKIALEPLHPVYAADRSCLSTIDEALDLCDRLAPASEKMLGVCLDVYHIWWDPALERAIDRAKGRILGFHVCDWLLETKDVLNDRGMMGDGVIDIRAIRAMVEKARYRGLVEVEIFSAANWWRRPIEETLKVCKERLGTVC